MAYTDNFIDPGVVDDPFAAFENAPVQPPVDYGAAPLADEWSRPQSFGDFGEVARDTRLAAPPVDETAVQEYEPGESYTEPYVSEPEYQPPWQGVADALGGGLNAIDREAENIWEDMKNNGGPGSWLPQLIDSVAGPYIRSNAGTATDQDIMDIGADKVTANLGPVGAAVGAVGRRVPRIFVREGSRILDDVGKVIARFGTEGEAERVVQQLNRAPTESAARAEVDAAQAGMDQLRIPGVDDIAPGRIHGFDVPAQSMPRHARPDRFEQQQLLDDTPTQPPLPDEALPPSPPGTGWFNPRNPEVLRAEADDAAAQATLNARGGIVGMAKGPKVTELESLKPRGLRPDEDGARYAITEPGKPTVDLTITVSGDKAKIEWIGAGGLDPVQSSNKIGPAALRSIAERVKLDFPQVTTVEGMRVGGSFNLKNPRWDKLTDSGLDSVEKFTTLEDARTRTWNVDQILRGRGPIIPGGIRNVSKTLDELDAEAAAQLGKDPEYAEQLLMQADDIRGSVGRFTKLVEEDVGAPVTREGVEGIGEFVESAVSGGDGAMQQAVRWSDGAGKMGRIYQTATEKAGQVIPAMRSMMATLDISLALRQGIIPAIAHSPEWNKAMDNAAKALWSDEGYRTVEKIWKSTDSYATAKSAGVAEMAIDNADQMQKVEYFQSELVESLPVFGKLTQASSRHAAAFGNSARFSIFDTYYNAWGIADVGKTDPAKAQRMAEDLASWVNSITGIGDMGRLNKHAGALSQLFFAPKFFASRINNIFAPFVFAVQASLPAGATPAQGFLHGAVGGGGIGALGGALANEEDRLGGAMRGGAAGALGGGVIGSRAKGGGDWKMAGLAFRDMSAYYATMFASLKLAEAAGVEVGLDAKKSDFMTMTVGDHHINMSGGYSSVARTMWQLYTGEKINYNDETENIYDPKFTEKGVAGVVSGQARSLLAPAVSSAVNIGMFQNRDIANNPLGVTGHIPLPMGLSELWAAVAEDVQRDPSLIPVGVGTGIMGMLGIDARTYDREGEQFDVSQNPVDLWLSRMTGIGQEEEPTDSGVFR